MRNLTFTIFFMLLAVSFSNAQYFQATIDAEGTDLVFKIRPNPTGGDISTGWSDIEFFVRWPDGSPAFNFGTLTVNTTDFPGVSIPNNGTNAQGSEIGYTNNWFGSSFSTTTTVTYTAGVEYEVFRVSLDIPASSVDFELVHNTFFYPHYLALINGSGQDLTNPGGVLFYGPEAEICSPNCPSTTGGNNHIDPLNSSTLSTWYEDSDGDGYGNPDSSTEAAGQPTGYVADNTDCDDTNATAYPGAPELCDGLDNDCNDLIDDGLAFTTYYADADNDGYGDADNTVSTCDGPPAGYVADNTDCDDTNAAINPGATEICDGIDNDCDGQIDDLDPDITGQSTWFADNDGDGSLATPPTQHCRRLVTSRQSFVADDTDCDDNDPNNFPGNADEVCDRRDNDCDGLVDDLDPDIDDTNPPGSPITTAMDGDAANSTPRLR
ncbi:MAG: putative metal-binding motif-containing protein [Lewinellaceae bacterium]|nr:putative metal-binding motif-containing protein [Lewinellaceae bacterium]